MRTTIDLPDEVYREAKIRAAEKGWTLKSLFLTAIRNELNPGPTGKETTETYWANRGLRPGFREDLASKNVEGGPGSTRIMSEERDSRDASLL